MAHILVIDDDELVRSTLQAILEAGRHRVAQAPDGPDGIRQFEADGADLVITDLLMPEMEGTETIRHLRAISPDTPILATTGGAPMTPHEPGEAPVDDLEHASRAGATRTIRKPFTARQLLDLVTEMLVAGPPC